MEAVPGYLSLHQSAESLTLKWTPNQLMNGTLGDTELEKRWGFSTSPRSQRREWGVERLRLLPEAGLPAYPRATHGRESPPEVFLKLSGNEPSSRLWRLMGPVP